MCVFVCVCVYAFVCVCVKSVVEEWAGRQYPLLAPSVRCPEDACVWHSIWNELICGDANVVHT